MTCLLLFAATVSANAQFEQGTKYVAASLSNLGLSYGKNQDFRFGVDAEAGYYFADQWMLRANVGYMHLDGWNDFHMGAGVRYNITQNGLFLGAGLEYSHLEPNYNSLQIPVELGYSFFLNKNITIEPAVYYKMSLNDFSDNSTVGLRIGFGFYLD